MGNVPPSALRQPPPPRRRLLVDSNTVTAPTTGKAEGDTSRVRIRPLYLRRCKKANNASNSMIDFESLPDELLIEILVCLSADEIYDNARLVCRRWCHLIHSDTFVSSHFHRASCGLLLKPLSDHRSRTIGSPILVTATSQGRVVISELSCRVNFPFLFSCNGLALGLREDGSFKSPFIFNPATKSAFILPKFPVREQLMYRLGIAYAAASMAYKVVGLYLKSGIGLQCGILTAGVDNHWRQVAVEGLSPEARCVLTSFPTPLMTRGFVHWVSEAHVVSLNVETEILTETPIPAHMLPPDYEEDYEEIKPRYLDLSTGEYISIFIPRGDWSWEVWEMKPETWEWKNALPCLDLEAHKGKIQQFASEEGDVLKPVGWVRYPEVLAFCFNGLDRSLIVYNLDTEKIDSIELSTYAGYHTVVQHRNSLVWSEQC